MKLIEQMSTYWGECPTDRDEAIIWIENAGRTCYRSEDKIIEGSGKKFVEGILKRGHFSVIEHSNLVLRTAIQWGNPYAARVNLRDQFDSKFLSFHIEHDRVYIGGNYRAWMECLKVFSIDAMFEKINPEHFQIIDDVSKIPIPLKMVTASFVTDRAVTHELVRHRPVAYSQESQRYVRYEDGDMEFIKPHWVDSSSCFIRDAVFDHYAESERAYKFLRNQGIAPQDARVVLPNSTATKIVVTCNVPEWNHIFNMRTSAAAYPMIRSLINPIKNKFGKYGWLDGYLNS